MKTVFNKLLSIHERPIFMDFTSSNLISYIVEHEDEYVIINHLTHYEKKEVSIKKEEINGYSIRFFQMTKKGLYVLVFAKPGKEKIVRVYNSKGEVNSAFTLDVNDITCYYVDDNDHLWFGVGDTEIYSDENPDGSVIYCYNLIGKQIYKMGNKFVYQIDSPSIDECYALTKHGNEYFLAYYSGLNILAYDSNEVKKAWVLEGTVEMKGTCDALGIYEECFWIGTEKNHLYCIPSGIRGEAHEIIPVDNTGKKIGTVEKVTFSEKGIYLYSNHNIYHIEK
ncbi:hypothetical protein [Shouchella lehensis]|uniref:WG repeat-containing protein n=1 Tax=Shouchella lehensis TaxID=300825 RepID=A0A4Y7WNE3_9BACI|nr:hypothetical protein [Shouchella lehensis]MBG9782841.1 hypothetical protein [Shouchella lehensis]TES49814.1 hypothetical protein E2L03_10210 [Shouchella lehensis]